MILKALNFIFGESLKKTTARQPQSLLELIRNDGKKRSGTKAFIDEVTGNQATLIPGCIVACDLLGVLDHTGIYVGRNRIVEKNGDGEIKRVTPDEFMNSSTLRSGATLFVACCNGKPIHRTEISRRAREAVGTSYIYDLATDNCHRLTAHCATGKKNPYKEKIWSFSRLVDELEEEFGPIEWKSAKYR